jgi:hypothetical protein
MVLTDFTITAADVGRALGVPDGYLVNLAMTQGPAYETPRRVWLAWPISSLRSHVADIAGRRATATATAVPSEAATVEQHSAPVPSDG